MFDLEKLGFQYYKLDFTLNNSKEKEKLFTSYIKENPNIVYDNKVLGGEDVEIEIQVRNPEELRKILKEIKEKFSAIIRTYSTMLFYKEHKFVFFPL